MPSKYTVVQFVPDPTTEERVNIGVMTWDHAGVRSQFLEDWRRVRAFSVGEVGFVRDIAAELAARTAAQGALPLDNLGRIDEQRMETLARKWRHCIQFTPPRGSLKNADTLLTELAPVFLRSFPRVQRRGRTRRAAAGIAARAVATAVKHELPNQVEELVKRDETLSGHFDQHRFDIVLRNGKPLAAVHALSFEIAESERLDKEIDATAWSIDDVRKKYSQLPLAVFVLDPLGQPNRRRFTHAQRLFRALHADVLNEARIPVWATKQARTIAARGPGRTA